MPHDRSDCHCCPPLSNGSTSLAQLELSRRAFLAAGGVVLSGLAWAELQTGLNASEASEPAWQPKPRKPLVVKPILVHDLPTRQEQKSWRKWGGIQTLDDAQAEVGQIKAELATLKQRVDFPVDFLDVASTTDIRTLKDDTEVAQCDLVLLFGAGYGVAGIQDFGKDVIIFLRWRSGPVYLQYEIVSPRLVRQLSDRPALPNIRNEDIVIDDMEELDWRLRALCGLKNSVDSKIVTIGGALAWGGRRDTVPDLVRKTWGFQYHDVGYETLSTLIDEAKASPATMARAAKRAEAYLAIPGTKLEASKECFVNNFILDDIFRLLMKQADTDMITVGNCMGAIMTRAKTSACMTLSILNDDGFMAFCESDFVVIPCGVLLGRITGKPVFLNDPTFPHKGIITLAHCTGPRKMDGKNYDPARIVTHFESDYGAAPKVEVPLGMVTTSIMPAFDEKRWVGLKGTICDVPFRPICRTQFDIKYECSDMQLAEQMQGFHWMTGYGDYRKEIGYALRKIGFQWIDLNGVAEKRNVD